MDDEERRREEEGAKKVGSKLNTQASGCLFRLFFGQVNRMLGGALSAHSDQLGESLLKITELAVERSSLACLLALHRIAILLLHLALIWLAADFP